MHGAPSDCYTCEGEPPEAHHGDAPRRQGVEIGSGFSAASPCALRQDHLQGKSSWNHGACGAEECIRVLTGRVRGDSDEEIAVDLESIHSDEELYDELQETLSSHVCVSMQVFPLYTRTHSL